VCLVRGEWLEVMIISCGVEISIAGGVEETNDVCVISYFFLFLLSFLLFKSYVHCFYGTRNDMHLE